jgi:hypothetical protein
MANMVSIPVGQDYTATCEATVPKKVRCEQCRGEYFYLMKRLAVGSATSPLFLDNQGAGARARERAEDELQRQLKLECDPVPCPACGWYQAQMVATIRRAYRGWMRVVGAILLAASAPSLAFTVSCASGVRPTDETTVTGLWILTASLALFGLGSIVGRKIMASRYDPNATDPDERRRVGQGLTIRKEDLEEQLRLLGE